MTAPAPLGLNVINNHIAKRAPSRHDNTVKRTLELLRDRMADKLAIRLGAVLSGEVFINCQDARARFRALGRLIVE